MSAKYLLAILCVVTCGGCATTTVKRLECEDECGLRFYRSKPYLLIKPADAAGPDKVSMSIEYLPDFKEEYVVQPYAGMGINETSVTLNPNGTLASMNVKLDSQFDENIKAFTDLAKAIPTGQSTPTNRMVQDVNPAITLTAYRVPLGLYEAVVSRGPDGCKRLYGWRYVGFAPFAQCPTESGGLAHTDCSEVLYGLVNIEGAMVFAELPEIASKQVKVNIVKTEAPDGKCDLEKVRAAVNAQLRKVAPMPLKELSSSTFKPTYDSKTNTFAYTVEGVAEADRAVVKSIIDDCVASIYNKNTTVTPTFQP